MRATNKLTVKGIESAQPGKYSDGAGLWLCKTDSGSAFWFLRYTIFGRRREMGLGGYPTVSLREARTGADKARLLVRGGKDPIKERVTRQRAAERNLNTLRDVALECFEARKAELKGDGKNGRWFSPLELHVLPKLGRVPISEIDQVDIRNTLAPIWHTKASTAIKALNRLGICLKHGAALGLDVDLNAVDKARALLGAQRHKVTNVPAMDWREVPAFYASLDDGSIGQLALRLLILTAGTRSKPIRYIRLDEIEGDVWTVPAVNMKSREGKAKDFAVPLSDEALRVIDQAMQYERNGYLFANTRQGVISDATMSRLMERRGLDARPHGFRASFRTWCDEAAKAPFEVAEASLAHATGSKVVQSYIRTDYLEQRRPLMQRWSDHVVGKVVRANNRISMRN